ncbi:putative histidine triad nucleotide binding protein [Ixodes scapularis]
MGRPRIVRTPEEQREYEERQREKKRHYDQQRRAAKIDELRSQEAQRKRQAREDPNVLAQEAQRKRQARQDPLVRAPEAQRKRQARQDNPELREAENAAKRRKYHENKLKNFEGADTKLTPGARLPRSAPHVQSVWAGGPRRTRVQDPTLRLTRHLWACDGNCTAFCQQCGHGHATTDRIECKYYTAAAQQPRETRPRPPQQVITPVALPAPDPSIRLRTPPPPPVVLDSNANSSGQASGVPSNAAAIPRSQGSRVLSNAAGPTDDQTLDVPLNAAATPDSQASDASSNAAATFGSRDTDVDDLSGDSDRLAIADEDDVTPGQGHPASTPEASSTTAPRESSAESTSVKDAATPDDRSDAKRVFSSGGSGSDAAPASAAYDSTWSRAVSSSRLDDKPRDTPRGEPHAPSPSRGRYSLAEDPLKIGAMFRDFCSSLFCSDPAVNTVNFAVRVRLFCRDLPACPENQASFSWFIPLDEEYVVFRDIHPASTHHYLVVPKMHIRSVKGLTPADIPLVRRLIDIGQQVLLEKGGTLDSLRMGFHWPPFTSINHLHLHIISPTEQMSTLSKVIYMPGSAWFCPVDDAIAYIERTGTSPEA